MRSGFLEHTPLWYYILAEAKHTTGSKRLGPVGSTIVAEVLIGLVRRSEDSIPRQPGVVAISVWRPTRPLRARDLLRFAQVLQGGVAPRTYIVQPDDMLSSIAVKQLGDADRWPDIFALNHDVISNPNVVVPGQVLILPN